MRSDKPRRSAFETNRKPLRKIVKKILHRAMFFASIAVCLIIAVGNVATQSEPTVFHTTLEKAGQKRRKLQPKMLGKFLPIRRFLVTPENDSINFYNRCEFIRLRVKNSEL